MSTTTTASTSKRFLVALPIFDSSLHDEEPDEGVPRPTPHSWLFTVGARDLEAAIEVVYKLIADERRLAHLHGGICFDVDEEGNDSGSLSYNGFFIGKPTIVEILGEAVGVREIPEAVARAGACWDRGGSAVDIVRHRSAEAVKG
jgi:hypothetical protein